MQKYLLNTVVVLFLFSLVGCQSNQTTSNLLGPFSPSFGPSTSTNNLAQTVQEALMRSGDPRIAQVNVQTRQDVVILTGYVKKIRQSDVAEQIARQTPGVRSVENNIIIRQ
jgi:osmotically-inducible protein OsmY